MCNPCISPLTMWKRIQLMKRCTTLCDKVCQWLATGRWFSSVSLTNKTDWNDIPELLLKVALNTSILTLTNRPSGTWYSFMNQEGDSIPTWNAWSWLLRHFVLCIICPSAFMTVCLVFVYIEVFLWFRLVLPSTESISLHRLCIPSMIENQSTKHKVEIYV